MAPSAEKIKKRLPAQRSTHTPVDLIRLLVRLAGSQDDRVEQDGHALPSEEIILEADLDGARYVLIRIPNGNRPRVQLSPREQEIVRMVAEGHSNKIIAEVLSISSWTVCTHLRRIFAKLGVGSRAAMVARLLERLSAYLTPHPAIPQKPRLRAVEKASSIKSLKQPKKM
jgi:DNA-binding CsgD family transcriptional regulator